jgi:hypothetical protein
MCWLVMLREFLQENVAVRTDVERAVLVVGTKNQVVERAFAELARVDRTVKKIDVPVFSARFRGVGVVGVTGASAVLGDVQ